jgi:hypothetical protein
VAKKKAVRRERCNVPCPIGNQGWTAPLVRKPCVRKLGHPGLHWNKIWEWETGEYPGRPKKVKA